MARISKADVHAALERVAGHLKNAGGPDGIVSRKDARDALRCLEGTEQALTDTFYRFTLARDAAFPARITRADVDAAAGYAKGHLIDRYDLNRNGLSKDEIAAMSKTGRLAVSLARQLKAAVATGGKPTGQALAKRIGELVKGLYFDDFASESAQPLHAVHVKAGLARLTQATFRAALGLSEDRPEHVLARFEPATGALFERFVDDQPAEARDKAGKLVKILRESLRETTVVIVGQDDPHVDPLHPAYIVGISMDGDLVGFRSAVVWT